MQAIEKGNTEGARIYAQNAIREKNQALNYLRLASRLDAVYARLNEAYKMKRVTTSMTKIVSGLEKSLQSQNLQQITQVMDKFESQLEDLDVQSEYVSSAMNSTATLTTPQDEVCIWIGEKLYHAFLYWKENIYENIFFKVLKMEQSELYSPAI